MQTKGDGVLSSHKRLITQTDINERFLSEKELAARWGISIKLLQKKRYQGGGVAYRKLGSMVRYALSDIVAYEDAIKKNNSYQ